MIVILIYLAIVGKGSACYESATCHLQLSDATMILTFSSHCHNHDHYYRTPSNEIITTLQLIFREVVSFVSRYSMPGGALRGAGVQILMNPTMTGLIKENYQGKWFPV